MPNIYYGITIWDASEGSKSFRMPWAFPTPVGSHFYLGLGEELSIFARVQTHMHGWSSEESSPASLQDYYMVLGVEPDDIHYSKSASSALCNEPVSPRAAEMWEILERNGWQECSPTPW